METWTPNYQELKDTYTSYYSVSNFNCSFEDRLTLIAIVCYITQKLREKNPDITCWEVLAKIVFKEGSYCDDFIAAIRGLAIMCEDFMQGTTGEIHKLDFKSNKEMIAEVKRILDTWIPF